MGEISVWTYLIVCPLIFLGGFVDSIAGGGWLITLPAYPTGQRAQRRFWARFRAASWAPGCCP